jgi:hypothetical protein
MKRLFQLLLVCLVMLTMARGVAGEEVLVIGHPALPKTDKATLQRIYTGRAVSIGQQTVAPINLPPGNPVRDDSLQLCLDQNEEQYTGYWLVRRYVGKGAPPMELGSVDEVLRHVQATPGAIGYVPFSKLPRGANVIFRR